MKRLNEHSREALQVFDGVMLSDGSISKGTSCRFSLGQTGRIHKGWLSVTESALLKLGAIHTVIKTYPSASCKTKEHTILSADHFPQLRVQREWWYPEGVKAVPGDLELTPVTLAHWSMGDDTASRANLGRDSLHVALATEGFTIVDVDRLLRMLALLGITHIDRHFYMSNHSQAYIEVHTLSQHAFMRTIEPYVVPSFKYKVKWPNLSKIRVGAHRGA